MTSNRCSSGNRILAIKARITPEMFGFNKTPRSKDAECSIPWFAGRRIYDWARLKRQAHGL